MIEPPAGRNAPGAGFSTAAAEPILDLDHLDRMTLGDRTLEGEVLRLFDRQAAMLTERLRGAETAVVASSAHTLKGSARGIGAWRLARAAEQAERAVAAHAGDLTAAIEQLVGAVDETRRAIAARLRLN
jgi:HPt (histidine-containing phosphotransfer) domain-containing protein